MYSEIVLTNQSQPTPLVFLIWNDCSECIVSKLKLWDIPGLNSDELYSKVGDLKISTASERRPLYFSEGVLFSLYMQFILIVCHGTSFFLSAVNADPLGYSWPRVVKILEQACMLVLLCFVFC